MLFRAQSSVHLPLSSASGQQMFERSSASVDRETAADSGGMRTKRTASAHGLNMTSEGRTELLTIYMTTFATIMPQNGTIIQQLRLKTLQENERYSMSMNNRLKSQELKALNVL